MSRFHRQLDVVNQERLAATPITIIGAGAVGSFAALALSKSGAEHITVWDHDVVSEHNLSNQWFRPADVGRKKVEALAELVHEMSEVRVEVIPEEFVSGQLGEIVICAVDSMDARINIWRGVSRRPDLWLDARMGAEVGTVYTAGRTSTWYDDTLYPSSQAFRAPCTAKATMYCASGLASIVTAQVVAHVSGRPTTPEMSIDFRNLLIVRPGV